MPPPQQLSDDEFDDLIGAAENRYAEADWCAEMMLDLQKKHPYRFARLMRQLAWLRKEARKRGHRLAGDTGP